VIGSSRVMQIGNHNTCGRILNLSVPGATLQDEIAILSMAMEKYNPGTLYVGLDPWLMNSTSGEGRWSSLLEQYNNAIHNLKTGDSIPVAQGRPKLNGVFQYQIGLIENFLSTLYIKINIRQVWTNDDVATLKDKIRHDGSRIYSAVNAIKNKKIVDNEIDNLLNYNMKNYNYSKELMEDFQLLISRYHRRSNIVLILSPYHPEVYRRMREARPIYLDIETQFRDFGKLNELTVIGSYDPARVGCAEEEFYDWMHPTSSCMKKVLGIL
jgi:hypothetical protein